MNGRVLMTGLVLFALVFGVAVWWFQTRAYYEQVVGITEVVVAGAPVPVRAYRGIDASTSPLKLRACFEAGGSWPDAPYEGEVTPLTAPGWFDCFDAETIDADLASGYAVAVLAEDNAPFGFSRIIARYPDGRAFMWRQMNACGTAAFAGDPLPADCPDRTES